MFAACFSGHVNRSTRFPIHTTAFPLWSSRTNLLPPSFLLRRQRAPLEAQHFLSVQFCCFCELRTQRLLKVKFAQREETGKIHHCYNITCLSNVIFGTLLRHGHYRTFLISFISLEYQVW